MMKKFNTIQLHLPLRGTVKNTQVVPMNGYDLGPGILSTILDSSRCFASFFRNGKKVRTNKNPPINHKY